MIDLFSEKDITDINYYKVVNTKRTKSKIIMIDHNFYDIEPEDFTVEDYPLDIIKTKNPQIDIFRDDIAI